MYSQLIGAARRGDLATVKAYLLYGDDIKIGNDDSLRRAADNGYLEIVKFLIEHGASVNTNKETPLMCAAAGGHSDVVKFLIEYGANVYAYESAALVDALMRERFETIEVLLRVYYRDKRYDYTTFSASIAINNRKYINQHIKYGIMSIRCGFNFNINQVISKLLIRNILVDSSTQNKLAPVPAVYRIIHDGKYSNRLRKLYHLHR